MYNSSQSMTLHCGGGGGGVEGWYCTATYLKNFSEI